MADLKLSPDVKDVLERSTITSTSVTLPEQLEPALYRQVNKALDLAGGKWSRAVKAHLFTSDPRVKLGLALEGKAIVDEKKLYQAFYTPERVAALVVGKADVAGCRVLEPEAGDGALALACRDAGAREIVCVEIRPEAVKVLLGRKFPVLYEGDFLKVKPTRAFERVVMNPPFTKGQDLKHIAHALKFLVPGGILVSVLLANKTDEQLAALCSGCEWDVFDLGPGAFKESGTPVATSILTVQLH